MEVLARARSRLDWTGGRRCGELVGEVDESCDHLLQDDFHSMMIMM